MTRLRNSGNIKPDRRTIETQNQREEQWKHRTRPKNFENTEPEKKNSTNIGADK